MNEIIEGYSYQEFEPTPDKPCEIKSKVVGKNLLDKEVIITGTPIKYVNDYIRVCNELEEQKKLNEEHQKINGELREEVKKLEDNWNKLKEYIKADGVSYLNFADERCFCNKKEAKYILNKMQEIEKGDKQIWVL